MKPEKKSTVDHPTTTEEPDLNKYSVTTTDIQNGRLESFTFGLQRKKFSYIEVVGDYVEEKIPRFEDIWPWLGAYTENGKWHKQLDKDLEFIGITHYTILKSLCYIFRNKDIVIPNDPDQKYKNVIFHYAIINDCIKQICFHIIKFKMKLDPVIEFPIKKFSEKGLLKCIQKWFCKIYHNKFDSFEKSGGLVMKEIHNVDKFISLLNKNNKFDSFNNFKKDVIGPLRNAFIHNPSIDIFYRNNEILVVRPGKISEYKTIQSIRSLDRKDLEEPAVIMKELFDQLTEMLPSVWSVVYDEIEKINTHLEFQEKKFR